MNWQDQAHGSVIPSALTTHDLHDLTEDMESPVDGEATPTGKRSRRQVAFYPNMNAANKPTKPFSRSAAKRESVMALGSIEHLQHYFTKTGLVAERDSQSKPGKGMVPAIGGLNVITNRQLHGIPEFQLPPSPAIPQIVQPTMPSYVKTYELDPENLRPTVIEDLTAVETAWWLDDVIQPDRLSVQDAHGNGNSHDPEHVDVLEVLRTTTLAVRSVRNYLLSLPDDSSTTPVQPRGQFRPNSLSSTPLPKRQVSQPDSAKDPLSRIRRSALEVLGALRSIEERSRLPLSDDAYDAQSDHGEQASVSGASNSGSGSGSGSGGSHSRATSPDYLEGDSEMPVSISYIHVGGKHMPVPVWEDEEDFDLNHLSEEDREKGERWDERLVLGGGWLYRQDVKRDDILKEREVVSRYVDAVDDTLFGGRRDMKRGWVREREREKAERDRKVKGRRVSAGDAEQFDRRRSARRVVSSGMLNAMKGMVLTEEPEEGANISDAESIDDEELPEWAKRSTFENDYLGRLRALLQTFLPASLIHLLPPPQTDRVTLLTALSSGQLLCVAYNVGVRRSRKPWGYVSRDSIHDIAALEAQSFEAEGDKEKAKRGWTFRRTDNLRLWAAALKLRYNIPVHSPTPPRTNNSGMLTPAEATTPVGSPTPTMQRFPTAEKPIEFDAPLVARHGTGWEDMLQALALRWLEAVVEEKRGKEAS